MCGAARAISLPSRKAAGLSPRVWGSLAEGDGEEEEARSIPTCVGQPLSISALQRVT